MAGVFWPSHVRRCCCPRCLRCFCAGVASEYAILSIAAFSTAMHLLLHVVDNRMEGAWHAKATWVMLLEFFSEVGGCVW